MQFHFHIEGTELEFTEGIKKLMSAISDFAATVQKNFDSIQAGIKSLDDKIKTLQTSSGTLSAADQAALDVIAQESSALATAANEFPPAA